MKNWLKKWWFTLILYLAALFITVYSLVYLFIDDYAFVQFTHLTGGALLPSLFLICWGSAQVESKSKNIKVVRIDSEIAKTVDRFILLGYEVVDIKFLRKELLNSVYEIEFVKVEDTKGEKK